MLKIFIVISLLSHLAIAADLGSLAYSVSYAQGLGQENPVHMLYGGAYIEPRDDGSYVFHPAGEKHPAFVIGECLHSIASGIGHCLNACYTYFAAKNCPTPEGSYLNSCANTTVSEDEQYCKMTTSCLRNNSKDGYKINDGKWLKNIHPNLDNIDGALLVKSIGALVLDKDKTLREYAKQINQLSLELELVSDVDNNERINIENKRNYLLEQRAKIIGNLNAGDVLTINNEGHPVVVNDAYSLDFLGGENDNQAVAQFSKLASATGGIMGISKNHQDLSSMIELMFQHIMANRSNKARRIEIAFVIDSTGSMTKNINQVKDNLDKILLKLSNNNDSMVKIFAGIVEFRDRYEEKTEANFIVKINTNLTENFAKLRKNVNEIIVNGGGDLQEAVLDGLMYAKNKLSWSDGSDRFCILIGDAPGHAKTLDNLYNLDNVIDQFKESHTNIVVYPVFSK